MHLVALVLRPSILVQIQQPIFSPSPIYFDQAELSPDLPRHSCRNIYNQPDCQILKDHTSLLSLAYNMGLFTFSWLFSLIGILSLNALGATKSESIAQAKDLPTKACQTSVRIILFNPESYLVLIVSQVHETGS